MSPDERDVRKSLGNPVNAQEIRFRLAQLSPEDAARWGSMSVHQMICHLDDSYKLALGQRTATPATGYECVVPRTSSRIASDDMPCGSRASSAVANIRAQPGTRSTDRYLANIEISLTPCRGLTRCRAEQRTQIWPVIAVR